MSDCAPSSTSILRRERLSMITTSWPASERCSAVGPAQKPPPSTKPSLGLLSPPLALCDAGIAISALCCGAATIDGSPARWSTRRCGAAGRQRQGRCRLASRVSTGGRGRRRRR